MMTFLAWGVVIVVAVAVGVVTSVDSSRGVGENPRRPGCGLFVGVFFGMWTLLVLGYAVDTLFGWLG